MAYDAPLNDMAFALQSVAGLSRLEGLEAFGNYDPELITPILEEANKLARDVLAPLNASGDAHGAVLTEDGVRAAPGFADAYAQFREGGWMGLSAPEEWGGQGLPKALALAVMEMFHAANRSFGLCPMLSFGAVEALLAHGTDDQKQAYLPNLVAGNWTGTMNLTEPQAGSDVGALKTRAVPKEDGSYAISGQKIFITWGDHDVAENIIHLVLARLPDAPAGSRGISLFIVPKFMVEADGGLGARNTVKCIGLEKKMGIHASPTCVMSYGDNDECIGELVGAENRGLAAMFTMMNNARINVGSQGVQIAERATQQALDYAKERIQSARAGAADRSPAAIIEHPDVRRMLVRMRSLTEAMRGLLYYTAGQVDRGDIGDSAAAARAEVLVPMLKAWATDTGIDVASLGIQVHGGMGFIEETGAAQHWRDSRIAPIYEGTNGIQAADLVTRKLGLEDGQVLQALFADIARDAGDEAKLQALAGECAAIAKWMREEASLDDRLAGSVPYTAMCAVAVSGWCLLEQHRALADSDEEGRKAAKRLTTRYFLDQIVPEAIGLKAAAVAGAGLLYELETDALVG